MNIYLVRHGRQSSTLCNVDVSLSAEGREQAKLAGRRLAAYDIDCIYTSDMLRAVETAELIKGELEAVYGRNLPFEIRHDIREYYCGDMEGLTIEEQQEKYGGFLEERELFRDVPYPGGESGQDVFDRFYPVLLEIARSGFQNVAVATHGGAIRAVLAGIFFGDEDRKLLFCRNMENTGITELRYNEENQVFYLERLNDYAHLERRPELLRRSWRKDLKET
ncbi:histidine phosphatase family protein [Anaerolentibacter hominis]|uniref:histidine phosphatase family protein n=1 Tax=Anaerolentibacter hominis TaxID=3079009 RepID=UPI0031B869DA